MVSPSGLRIRLALACLAFAVGAAGPSPAAAGVCPLDDLPPFAGHTFPLESAQGTIGVTRAFPNLSNFSAPVLLTAPPAPSSSMGIDHVYVVQQRGLILHFENRSDVEDDDVTTLIDLSGIINTPNNGGTEEGLLGLAFDPDFWTNGYFYVNYTNRTNCTISGDCTRVVRYETDAQNPPSLVGNGNPTLLLEFSQNANNHNGGMLAFGPDGMLYVSIGDGGGGNDPDDRAQDLTDIRGSIARIDPHAPAPHIPPDNPFVGVPDAAEEIYHYGLRNPWRMSFDRLTGDLWIGDVGQRSWEEVDFVPAGGPAGQNFGWRDCEGNHDSPGVSGQCNLNDPDLTFPVLEYDRNVGVAITGGYVYRGSRAPSLYGFYVYADYGSSRMFAWDQEGLPDPLGTPVPSPSSFGEDESGELYVVSLGGGIYWFEEQAPVGGGPPPTRLSETGLFQDVETLTPAPGLVEYEVNTPLWSDRASKKRWLALPAGQTIGFAATGAWTYPDGTAFVKHFELEVAPGIFRRLETRVFLKQTEDWVGYTYRWNEDESDADLLTAALDEVFDVALPGLDPTQNWHYPGPGECLACHSIAGGRVLGGRTRQLNRLFDYPGDGAFEQLVAWSCGGLLDTPIGDASAYGAFRAVDDEQGPVHDRVLSYLQTNCAFCHQPGGPAPGDLDLRYDTPVTSMNLLGVAPDFGDLGVPGALRIDPGDHPRSVMWLRSAETDEALRMAQGTRLRDEDFLPVLAAWIDQELIDPDADGLLSFEDNCPVDANGPDAGPNDQDDTDADGTGDVCECSYVPGQAMVGDGDFDRSGQTDASDLGVLEGNFAQPVASFDEGDANCDGLADGADYTIWADDAP